MCKIQGAEKIIIAITEQGENTTQLEISLKPNRKGMVEYRFER